MNPVVEYYNYNIICNEHYSIHINKNKKLISREGPPFILPGTYSYSYIFEFVCVSLVIVVMFPWYS